jgi:iron complex transport system substrate-binding protein
MSRCATRADEPAAIELMMRGDVRTPIWPAAACRVIGALAALSAFALPHPAAAQVTLRDDRGVVTTLARPPQRIVSLLPSLTESLCALGECARLVGTDRFSNWPPSVQALPKLGGIDDAQIERIVRLKPDLVLAAPSARAIERLETLGVAVVVLESKRHADVQRTLALLATALGKPQQAARVWAQIQAEMQAAEARVPAAMRGQRVYFEVESAPYAAGPQSFIGESLQRLGLGNIAPVELGPFPKLNPEFVVRAQPDVIVAARRNLAEMARRPGWSALGALQRGRVCGFEPDAYEVLIRPGPRMGAAALQIADCLAALAGGAP